MNSRRTLLIALLLLTAGLGAYAATLATRSATSSPAPQAPDPLLDWLDLSPAQRRQLQSLDPSFPEDLQRLRADLHAARADLATALESAQTPDDLIRQRSEAVIAAGNALERRVTTYLLSVRRHLAPAQQKRLFTLAADNLRRGGQGHQWRHGQQDRPPDATGRYGKGKGRAP